METNGIRIQANGINGTDGTLKGAFYGRSDVRRDSLHGMSAELNRRFSECRLETSPIEKAVENGCAEYRVELEKNQLIDQVVLAEELSAGAHVRAFTVYVSPHRGDQRIAVYRGETIGRKHICTFPTIRGKLIDVVVDESDGCENVADIGALYVGDRSGRQIRG